MLQLIQSKWLDEGSSNVTYVMQSDPFIDQQMNEIFGKIGRFAPENVTLQLIQSKCVPALLYGIDACPLNKNDITSLDFDVNQFFYEIIFLQAISISSPNVSKFQF